MPPQPGPIVKVKSIESYIRPVHTRMPFRYGSARLVECPHLYLVAEVEDSGGRRATGIAADNLPPRWFDKDPDKSYPRELLDQRRVIQWACDAAMEEPATTPFRLWFSVYHSTLDQGRLAGLPPLLSGFGPSLVERAVNDAVGRLLGLPLHLMLSSNVPGIEPGMMDSRLDGVDTSALIPARPVESVIVRHAVGLSDPIVASDIPPDERLKDGLPQSLDEVVHFYGVRYFKIKTSNHEQEDLERLTAIAAMLDEVAPYEQYRCTLDGNEQYESFEQLMPIVDALRNRPSLTRMGRSILFIEQPLARSAALDPDRCRELPAVAQSFPVIIDESDDSLGSFPAALALGYTGVSHKNCKNLFKSIANLARIGSLGDRERHLFLSAEDLTNIGSVALEEDLCALGTLGIPHAERNGYHYFRGLTHLNARDQEQALRSHPDLYVRADDFVRVNITGGKMACGSIHRLPGLGVGPLPSLDDLAPASSFDFDRYL